ncbi:1,8-cineole synthase, chloroplastic-like [Salvia splendens]|uniref:1,8-cineole synthase, chloroplastic-like n=1 Tax=Salvia splendens TaxID=180675 RepID=UPI001103A870|nr:1,8-cineole synthase, chloroplastic-like [Salvia splendens]
MMKMAIQKPINHLRNYSHTNVLSSKLPRVSSTTCRRLPPWSCSYRLSDHRGIQLGRRSGGYPPSIWDFHYIQALNSEYKGDMHQFRAAGMIAQVKMLLLHQQRFELIDDLRRLGISCHFRHEIAQILDSKYINNYHETNQRDLYSTSLRFRLLRQYGFTISQDVFDCFKNDKATDFDTKGLLQLYEASFLATHGEETLEIAKQFAAKSLHKRVVDHEIDDIHLLSSVEDVFEFPSHWMVQMPNAKAFIDAYKRRPDMDSVVLELAKLDINIVQAKFLEELKETSRWWESTGLAQELPFIRDRIVECYYWTNGVVERREHGFERIMLAKINALITAIDDIYDVYGTLEELQLFTDAIRRWDIESIDKLPIYMKVCYLALYNFVNEMGYYTLKDKGFNSIPFLRKAWVDLIEAYLIEANWYHKGYKPSLEEYINNAWITVGGVPVLSHLFFRVTDSLDKEAAESVHKYHEIVRASCTITRLADDMGTSMAEVKRGDVPKSVQCYMNEKNASEEEARTHVQSLIEEKWKTMNKEMMDSPFSTCFVEVCANLARMAQLIYQKDSDGFGMQHSVVNKQLRSLLFEPYE